ncbi:MAG: hypothetical protein EOP00_16845 [Pedobacter sp.]|nr:MAG: hypothetical protein EOP00_16845 [Pedobacter sp.]
MKKIRILITFFLLPLLSVGQTLVQELDNGLLIYKKFDKFGIGQNDQVEYIFDSIYYPKYENYIMLQKNNLWGTWDIEMNQILPFEYEAIRLTRYKNEKERGMFFVKKNGKLGTVDKKNKVVIPLVYDDISRLNEHNPGVHYVVRNGKTGISSFKGEIIIPVEYDSLYYFRNQDLIKAKKNNLVGVLNSKNKVLIPFKYQNIIFDFYDDSRPIYDLESGNLRFVVKENNVWSLINFKGDKLEDNISEKEILERYGKYEIKNYDFYYATVCLIDKDKNYR